MILCDFLCRVAADGGDPMDLVPVAFNGMSIMHERYNHMDEYKIMTRMQRVAAGMLAPPRVHGANKAVNPKLKPEKHAVTSTGQLALPTPTIAAQREKVRFSPQNPILTPPGLDPSALDNKTSTLDTRKRLQKGTISTPIYNQDLTQKSRISDPVPKTLALTSRENMPSGPLGPMPLINAPSQELIKLGEDLDPAPEIDPNLEVPIQEAQIEAMFRAPEPGDFVLPPALSEHTKGKPMVAQNLPKQFEIDKLLKQLNRKILTQTRYPSSLKDLEAAYCDSAPFKEIYQFLRYNKLPSNRRLAKRVEASAQDYYVLGTLLFKYINQKSGDIEAVLCIPLPR